MSIDILLVEDHPGDVRLTREAFRGVNEAVRIHVASNGVEALAFLRRQGEHVNAPRPDIILLDLNLPKMDGRQVLAIIKKDEALRMIPVVVLTTSESEADVSVSYQLQANCYVRKTVHWDAFIDIVSAINDFWLTKVRLPQRTPSG
jgi:chemotaxis family two-component system response regulator Rcp1